MITMPPDPRDIWASFTLIAGSFDVNNLFHLIDALGIPGVGQPFNVMVVKYVNVSLAITAGAIGTARIGQQVGTVVSGPEFTFALSNTAGLTWDFLGNMFVASPDGLAIATIGAPPATGVWQVTVCYNYAHISAEFIP